MSYQLKDLQMLSYLEVVAMTSAKACVWLQKHGVLLPPKTVRSFVCWICKTEMKHDRAADTLRCTANKCTSNPRVLDPETMFDPLHATVSSGNEVQYDLFLRTAYALSCKLSNDSAVHMVRGRQQSFAVFYQGLGTWYKAIRVALAYTDSWTVTHMFFV